jgi:hypothetical protein
VDQDFSDQVARDVERGASIEIDRQDHGTLLRHRRAKFSQIAARLVAA